MPYFLRLGLAALLLVFASVAVADEMNFEGAVKIGGIFRDETGDLSTVQETYNLYEGFSVSQLYLKGRFNSSNYLRFDITNINLPNRIGTLEYRIPRKLRLTSRFTQNRQVFDPTRTIESSRKMWTNSLTFSATRWLDLIGDYNYTTRTGDRLGYPNNVQSELRDTYDFYVHTGRLAAEVKRDRYGFTLAGDFTNLTDNVNRLNDRTGSVASANLVLPGLYFKRLTHVMRGAIGQSRLPESDEKFDLYTFQYTGVFAARREVQLKYRFFISRVDDESTNMPTDNWINEIDAVYFYRLGMISAGYGWEARDDDRVITTYNNFRVAGTIRTADNKWRARVAYRNRLGEDKEQLTLLKDSEWQTAQIKVDGEAIEGLRLGGRVANRRRDLPDIGVSLEGVTGSLYGEYRLTKPQEPQAFRSFLRLDYSYADDDYTNTVGSFRSVNRFVTARLEGTYNHWRGGVSTTYLNVGGTLDVRKYVNGIWAGYTLADRWTIDARYNLYSFDDYLILDRYYTGNFVWLDVGYKFNLQ